MESKTIYFENTGAENTEATLQAVRRRADELGIKKVVVASHTGKSAIKALDILKGIKVIAVTHVTGFREPNVQELNDENRKIIESQGGAVLTAAHALAGISVAMRNKYQMPGLGLIIADTLRIFGQGTKVACEVAMMATDAGLVRTDEDIISIGGTNGGSDTALVVTPANTHRFFELKVREILCKPRL